MATRQKRKVINIIKIIEDLEEKLEVRALKIGGTIHSRSRTENSVKNVA